jgi:hypothetical protein
MKWMSIKEEGLPKEDGLYWVYGYNHYWKNAKPHAKAHTYKARYQSKAALMERWTLEQFPSDCVAIHVTHYRPFQEY